MARYCLVVELSLTIIDQLSCARTANNRGLGLDNWCYGIADILL
jgi:hypothetical protein